MTSRESETHCVGSHSANKGSFKNSILVLNELRCSGITFHLFIKLIKVILQFCIYWQINEETLSTIFENFKLEVQQFYLKLTVNLECREEAIEAVLLCNNDDTS